MAEMTAQSEIDRRATRLATHGGICRPKLRDARRGYGERARAAPLQRADVRDHRPDLGVLVLTAERRHRREAQPVLHDPKELCVGLTLRRFGREIGRVGVRRGAEHSAPVALCPVADRARTCVRDPTRIEGSPVVRDRVRCVPAEHLGHDRHCRVAIDPLERQVLAMCQRERERHHENEEKREDRAEGRDEEGPMLAQSARKYAPQRSADACG